VARTWTERAAERVAKSPRLAAHRETIEYDWREQDESHEQWVATAPIAEIVDWAETVEAAAQDA
jgi:hypothetical protein